ncbi:MFS transporter [Methanobacterium sp. BAmetb5]|uniref:MFS transporter n=1 Tax=Methanobacterium sp. BAmetb5 TaxID=2025351 RepID=UPI000E83017C|nr:MFS transporter [Methanobacterium sp. BAmetb5]AXV40063.1 MAG: MFS transporter [Methanobacterium sp. BAmetb5]
MNKSLLNQYETPTKTHYKIFGLSWAGWVFDFYDLILFTFLIIPIGQELHLSNLMLSYALSASIIAAAVGGVLFGVLSDKYGRKIVLQLTIIIYSIGTVLCAFSTNLETLILFRIITGLGVGGEWATGQTYVNETFPAKLRGRFGAFLQTGNPVGLILASLVGGFLLPVIGWRASFLISVLPAILVILIRRQIPESDLWLQRKDNAEDKLKSLKIKSNEFVSLLLKPYRKTFLMALILAILGSSAYWFTYSWLPTYLQGKGISVVNSAMWIIVNQVGGILGLLFFGLIADRFGRRPAFSSFALTMAAGLIMITLFWNNIATYPYLIFVFMFMIGIGTGIYGGFGPLVSELFPTSLRSTAMGSSFNLARGTQFLTPILIALIGTKYGLGSGIFLGSVFALGVALFIWAFPETNAIELEKLEE